MWPFKDLLSLALINSIIGTLFVLVYISIVMKKRKIAYSLLLPNILLLISLVLVFLLKTGILHQMFLLFALSMFLLEAAGTSRDPYRIVILFLYTIVYGLILYFIQFFLPENRLLFWIKATGPMIPGIIYTLLFLKDHEISPYNRLIFSILALFSIFIHVPIILSAYIEFPFQGEALRIYLVFFILLGWDLAITGRQSEKTEQSKEESKKQLSSLFEQIDTLHNFLQHKDPSQDISSLYPRFFKILQERTGISKAVIYLLNSDGSKLILQAQVGLDQRTVDYLKVLPWEHNSITKEAMVKQKITMVDMRDYPESEMKDIIMQQNIAIMGSHPIISKGQAVGAVTFGLSKDQSPQMAMEEILKVLSIQMGTALFNLKWVNAISESEIRFKSIFNNLEEAILIHNTRQEIMLENQALLAWLNNENKEKILNPLMLQLENHYPNAKPFETTLTLSSGKKLFLTARIIASQWDGGPVFISILQNRSAEKELEQKLAYQKGIDPETGILSRRLVENIFKKELERAERFQHPFTILMIGLERKEILHGTIGPLAQALSEELESYEYLCYNGNGSFALLLPEGDIEASQKRAESILHSASSFKLPKQRNSEDVSLSIGMDSFNGVGKPENIHYYWNNADEALDISRKTGGNRIVRWTKDQI